MSRWKVFIGEHEYFRINSKSYSRTPIIRSSDLETLHKWQFCKERRSRQWKQGCHVTKGTLFIYFDNCNLVFSVPCTSQYTDMYSILGWSSTVLLRQDLAPVLFGTLQRGGDRPWGMYKLIGLAVSELARFYCTSQSTMKSSLHAKNWQVQYKNNASVNSCEEFVVLFSSSNTFFLKTY